MSMLRELHKFLQHHSRLSRNTEELEKLPARRGAHEQETSNTVQCKSGSAGTLTGLIVSWIHKRIIH